MPNLYIVATPIGNLEDITLRALRILREVNFILCEDTRVACKLFSRYEIKTPYISYHQHSKGGRINKILTLLEEGKNLALITDAGTPGISDPGNELIAQVIEHFGAKVNILSVPGPSAVTAALSIAGFPTSEFLFLGFLPHKKGRQTMLTEIVNSKYTVVVYESCHRIERFLEELYANNKEANIVVGRELTKMFESVYRGKPKDVLDLFKTDKNHLKGEFVVIVSNKLRK